VSCQGGGDQGVQRGRRDRPKEKKPVALGNKVPRGD